MAFDDIDLDNDDLSNLDLSEYGIGEDDEILNIPQPGDFDYEEDIDDED